MDQGKNIDFEKYLAARVKAAEEQLDNLGSLDYRNRGKKSEGADSAHQLKLNFKISDKSNRLND